MSEVLGRCPHCGEDITTGNYGPFCTGKCGFHPGKVLGRELSEAQITDILGGKEIFVSGLVSRKTGNTYSAYVKMKGVHSFEYKKQDGTMATGYGYDIDMRFPEKENASDMDVS